MFRRYIIIALMVVAIQPAVTQSTMEVLLDDSRTGGWRSIAHNGATTIIAVGSMGTIGRSTDNGDHWQRIGPGKLVDFRAIRYCSGTWVAAGYTPNGSETSLVVVTSTDNGNTWHSVDIQLSLSKFVYLTRPIITLSHSHSESNTIWLSIADGRILVSNNSGLTWEQHSRVGAGELNNRVIVAVSNLGTVYSATDSAVFRYEPSAGWQQILAATGVGVTGLATHNDTVSAVTRSTASGGLAVQMFSVNGGTTWSTYGGGSFLPSASVFVNTTGMLFVGLGSWQNQLVAVPAEQKGKWDTIPNSLSGVPTDCCRINDSIVVVCGNRNTIGRVNVYNKTLHVISHSLFRSTDALSTFRVHSDESMTYSGAQIGTFTNLSSDRVRSLPGTPIYPYSDEIIDVHRRIDGTVLALTMSSSAVYSKRSDDTSWTPISTGGIGARRVFGRAFTFSGPVGVFVGAIGGTSAGVMITTDEGSSWTQRNPEGSNFWLAHVSQRNDEHVVSAVSYETDDEHSSMQSYYYSSSNLGQSWSKGRIGVNFYAEGLVSIDGTNLVVIGRSSETSEQGMSRLYLSSDGGRTWTVLYQGAGVWFGSLSSQGDTCAVLCRNVDSMYVSVDKGRTWRANWYKYDGVGSHRWTSFRQSAVRNGYVYGVGSFGDTVAAAGDYQPHIVRFRLDDQATSITESGHAIQPTHTIVLYPQPANDVVFIEGCNDVLEATIVDSRGAHLQTVTKEPGGSTLKYMIRVDSYPPGIYYLRLKRAESVSVCPIIVSR